MKKDEELKNEAVKADAKAEEKTEAVAEEKTEAQEKTQTETKEETTPVIDFEKTEEYPDDYEKNSKEVKDMLLNKLQIKLLELVLGICFILLTTKTGVLGTFLFIAGLFYLIPDGLVKSLAYFYRYKHFEDYVESRDYKISENYWTIVMTKMREKGIFNSGKKDN